MTTDNREHIAALKAAAEPRQVAESLGLEGHGGRFWCPLCQADGATHKTPDLAVGGKGFTCHRCGEKGDILKLIQLARRSTFPDAVAFLERLTGIRPPERRKPGKLYPPMAGTTIVKPGQSWGRSSGVGVEVGADETVIAVYEAFLDACPPVTGRALDWLVRDKGIPPDLVESQGIHFCGREYHRIHTALKDRFGDEALQKAGLVTWSRKKEVWYPAFGPYYWHHVGFLVIPYYHRGRTVYLKARPPCGKAKAEEKGIPRFLNPGGKIPVLYNLDSLTGADKVLICEGETDTLTALSPAAWSSPEKRTGWAVVGSPGAKAFKPEWVHLFRDFVATITGPLDEERAAILEYDHGLPRAEAEAAACEHDRQSAVYLVLDADKAGTTGTRELAGMFTKAGLPVPLNLTLPAGQDLNDYVRDGGIIA